MHSFTEIVETWGRKRLVTDLGLPEDMPRQWSRDDSIHAKYWKKLLASPRAWAIGITPEILIELAARN